MTIRGEKKKREKHGPFFKLWEKNRRDRFNGLLDQLSKKLPGHDLEGPWSKSRIVEQAISFIDQNCTQKSSSEQLSSNVPIQIPNAHARLALLQKKCRQYETQITKLRELIRSNLAEEIPKEKFRRMTTHKILQHVALKKEAQNKKIPEEIIISSDDPSDIFVANIQAPNDHSYSLVVQSEPEVEVVSIQDQEDESDDELSLISHNTYNTVQPLTVYQTYPGTDLLSEIGTVNTILEAPQTVLVPVVSQQKSPTKILPWPGAGVVHTVSIYHKPLLATSHNDPPKEPIWKLPKKPRKKRVYRSKNDASYPMQAEVENNADPDSVAETATEAVEEPETQLLDETLTSSEPIIEKSPTHQVNDAKVDKEIREKGEIKLSKKSKNSYSIAALCQISVNIGGDPSLSADSLNVGVNSPGMVSLNSVGTASPVPTPDPTTTPPALTQPLSSQSRELDSSLKSTLSQPKHGISDTIVIEELHPVSQSMPPVNGPKADIMEPTQPLSPTKTFLTEFPVVKQKSQTRKSKKSQDKGSSSVQPLSSDLSVYDFNDTRGDVEVFDLGSPKHSLQTMRADSSKLVDKRSSKPSTSYNIEAQRASSSSAEIATYISGVQPLAPVSSLSFPSSAAPIQFYSPASTASGSNFYLAASSALTSSRSHSSTVMSSSSSGEAKQLSKSNILPPPILPSFSQPSQLLGPVLQSVVSMPSVYSSQPLSIATMANAVQSMPMASCPSAPSIYPPPNSSLSTRISSSQDSNFTSIYRAPAILNPPGLGISQSSVPSYSQVPFSTSSSRINAFAPTSTYTTTIYSTLPKQISNASSSNLPLPSIYTSTGTSQSNLGTSSSNNHSGLNLPTSSGMSSLASSSSLPAISKGSSAHHSSVATYTDKISSASSHGYSEKISQSSYNTPHSDKSATSSHNRYTSDYTSPTNQYKTTNAHFHHFPYPYPNLPPQTGPNFNMQQVYHQPSQHHQAPLQQSQSDFMMQQSLHPTYHTSTYSLQNYNLPSVNLGPPPLSDLIERPPASEGYCIPQVDNRKQSKATSRNPADLIPPMLPQQSYLHPPPPPSFSTSSHVSLGQPVMLVPQDSMGGSSNMMDTEQGSLFSVTQLVSAKGQSGSRKSSKRSMTSAPNSSRQSKQSRYSDLNISKEAERVESVGTKKSSSSKVTLARSSSYKSSSKRSYSAESLISNETIVMPLESSGMDIDPKLMLHHHQTSYKASDFAWSLGDQGSSSQLMFPPVSPSPASGSYFGADLSDFTNALFGTTEAIVSSPPNLSQTRSHYSQHGQKRSTGSSSSGNNPTGGVNSSVTSVPGSSHFIGQGGVSESDTSTCINHPIFDNFLLPSSADDHLSNCQNNSSVASNFLSNSMSLSIQTQHNPTQQHQSSSKQYYINQPYSSKSNQNIVAGVGSGSRGVPPSQSIHHSDQPQHLILPPISSGGIGSNAGSAYVNFNLSTIFPEINVEKLPVHALLPSHPPIVPPPSSMAGKTLSMTSTSVGGPTMDMRSIGTPDLLPHSIAILGHTSHQVPLGSIPSVHFPGSGFGPNMPQAPSNF